MLPFFTMEPNFIVAFKRYALHHLFSVCERLRHFYSVYAHATTHLASGTQLQPSYQLPVSKYPAFSVRARALDRVHAPSVEVPLAYTAVALFTRIHTASPVLFSIAGDVFLLREFVVHEQTCLHSVTWWKSLPV